MLKSSVYAKRRPRDSPYTYRHAETKIGLLQFGFIPLYNRVLVLHQVYRYKSTIHLSFKDSLFSSLQKMVKQANTLVSFDMVHSITGLITFCFARRTIKLQKRRIGLFFLKKYSDPNCGQADDKKPESK